MKRTIPFLILLCLITVPCEASQKSGYAWKKLTDGLEYARSLATFKRGDSNRRTTIHAFKIDPKKVRMDVLTASSREPRGESINRMAKREHALVAVNGGFFTPEHKSIGLLVKSGKQINPIHNTSWWSVFGLRNNRPSILPPWKAKSIRNYQMAVQVGPRLVVNGHIPNLKRSNPTARSAIGITSSGKVIIATTEGAGISMHELAERMRSNRFKGGFECTDAMALDGGSSTQLYAKVDRFKVSVSGLSSIPNGIGVFTK